MSVAETLIITYVIGMILVVVLLYKKLFKSSITNKNEPPSE